MVKRIFLIILVINFMIFFIGCSANNNDVFKNTTSYELNKVQSIAKDVSKIYKRSGKGVSPFEGYEALLKSEEGNCAQEAYIFARRISQLGYDLKVIGLFSYESLNHMVIEVEINRKKYLFDPTNGIYYNHGIFEIVDSPELSKDVVGFPEDDSRIYTTEKFFKYINKINVYHNLDYAEKDLAKTSNGAKVIKRSNFYNFPNNVEASLDGEILENYTAAVENTFPNYFEIDLGVKKQIYRIAVEWYSFEDYASDFEILYELDGKYVSAVHEKKYIEDDAYYQFILKEPINTRKIKFIVNSTHGQNRLLMKRFSVYQ